jgi:hypothetical protein
MKSKPALLIVAVLLAACSVKAKEVARVPAPEGVLPVVITEAVGSMGNAFTDYDRLDVALKKVAKERNWPLQLSIEKFASNTLAYETELNINIQYVRQQIPGEYLYRGWTSLWLNGKFHDFKIVEFRYNYRAGEPTDRSLEKLFLGAAKTIADKIEPLLFPDLKKEKK